MVRLLGDTIAQEGSSSERKCFLMDGLCRLIDAEKWVWGLHVKEPSGEMHYVSSLNGGFIDEQHTSLLKALAHPSMQEVAGRYFREMVMSETHITRLREQVDPQAQFKMAENAGLWRDAGIEHILLSARPLDEKSFSALGIYRSSQQPSFTAREVKIAHIILTEVTWLHEEGWPEDRGATVPKLYPQQRLVLNLLLKGMDRKTIASELEISSNTASGYIKEVYKHFNVHSHAQLIAKFYRGNGRDLPERS